LSGLKLVITRRTDAMPIRLRLHWLSTLRALLPFTIPWGVDTRRPYRWQIYINPRQSERYRERNRRPQPSAPAPTPRCGLDRDEHEGPPDGLGLLGLLGPLHQVDLVPVGKQYC